LGVCGDSMEVTIRVADGVLNDIRVLPDGCGYTAACASAMTELAKGRLLDEAVQLEPEDIAVVLGGLPQGHYHCAQLALESLCAAIEDYYRKNPCGRR
jgi:nitrogen fixation NifU-like protein